MNTKLTVKKTADTGWRKVKYGVVEVTVGSSLAGSYALIQTISPGFDTEVNFDKWKSTWNGTTANLTGRDPVGIVGTIGALEIVAMDAIVDYNLSAITPSKDQ